MGEPVTFYNRKTRAIETEAIYGERFLRWIYERPFGRAALWLLVKRAVFSRWYGRRMNQPASRSRIGPFIARYNINEDEMAENWESFANFNAFFSRRLKITARPVAAGPRAVIFPADGRHLAIPDLSANDGIFVKGAPFDLRALVRDEVLAARFREGSMLISRLCPVDYHRFHFPCAGRPGTAERIGGQLFSVSPIALRVRPSILWENERYLTHLRTRDAGEILICEIGATCVGTVCQTFRPAEAVAKGEEKGFFMFGGSCVITVFEPGRVKLAEDLLEHSAQQREVYAHMGDVAAQTLPRS